MGKAVLFVDDEQDILTMMECAFGIDGYTPRCTMDGNEALEIMEKENIRVVFTDVRMPIMDGTELCRLIRERFPDAFVFGVSAFIANNVPEKLSKEHPEEGFDASFKKPFSIDALLAACKRAFEALESS